jgi:hypothetical protein
MKRTKRLLLPHSSGPWHQPPALFWHLADLRRLLCRLRERLAVPWYVEVSARMSSQFEAGLDSYLALQQQNALVANIIGSSSGTSFPADVCP